MEHFLLHGKNLGNNRCLLGNILLYCIFLDDEESEWNDYSKNIVKEKVQQAITIIKNNARYYQVNVEVTSQYYNDKVLLKTGFRTRLFYDYMNQNKQKYLKQSESLKCNHLYDEVSFLFFVNKKSTSYANICQKEYPNEIEYAMVFVKNVTCLEATIVHETLHLFGAVDFYIMKNIKDLALHYFPDSIMLSTYQHNKVDELTAYIIGWRDYANPQANYFLYKTRLITQQMYLDEYNAKYNVSKGTIEFSTGIYNGEIENGHPKGYGKIVFTDESIYEGQWDVLRNGEGKTIFKDGTILKGKWKNDQCIEGTYYYPNGTILSGKWADGEMIEGIFYYMDGKTGHYKKDK